MIHVTTGNAARRLLNPVRRAPGSYSLCVICTPFLDEMGENELRSLSRACASAQCGFVLVTEASKAAELRSRLPKSDADGAPRIRGVPRLHAKAFVTIGRSAKDTRVLVTSANLTEAGLHLNFELGVIASPSCDAGKRVTEEVSRFLRDLVKRVN